MPIQRIGSLGGSLGGGVLTDGGQRQAATVAELNDRAREVLRLVVESYVETGEPVGSRALTRKLTGKASLASLLITVGLPVGIALTGAPAWEIVSVLALCALVLVRHLDNIKRLIGRRELSASSR